MLALPQRQRADAPRPEPRQRLAKRLSEETVREIVERYETCEHTPTPRKAFGLSQGGLLKLLEANGVQMRRQALTSVSAAEAAQLYASGVSIARIAEQVGSSYGAVRSRLLRDGVALRGTHDWTSAPGDAHSTTPIERSAD